jgi:signal transduction histidine kinase
LRTPVAIIRTTAEVARRKPRTAAEYEAALDRIISESERTTSLIEDLMLLTRADAEVESGLSEPLAMADLVRGTCADAMALAEAAGVVLSTGNIADCTVSGDRQALRRLFLILVDNAIKYSKPGGAVNVSLEVCTTPDRRMVRVEIRDNGIGISSQDLPNLFERFYRASKDRSRTVDGVGLGLSIAQSIARRHHGEIRIESTLGEGTTAWLLLPALQCSRILQNEIAE